MPDAEATLYLIYVRNPGRALDAAEFEGLRQLDDRLYLLQTGEDRSRLYHAIKRAAQPDSLLVAPLSEAPKFKGMAGGALKWLRNLG